MTKDQFVSPVHPRSKLPLLCLSQVAHCLEFVLQRNAGRCAKVLVRNIRHHADLEDKLLQAVDQILLRCISVWLLKEIHFQIPTIEIPREIYNPVFPDVLQCFIVQQCPENLHVRICKIIHIIRFFGDCLIVGINHCEYRFKDPEFFFILSVFCCRYTIETMLCFIVVLKLNFSLQDKVSHRFIIRNTAMQNIIGIQISPHEIPRTFQH